MDGGDGGASIAYAGAVIAMGTMHGKEHQVAPPFAAVLGAQVVAPPGIDTDQFGTFTGEVTRTAAPSAAATAKARQAMRAVGVPYGLASEASYDSWFAALAVHEEILVFVDDVRGFRIVESLCTPGAPGPPRLGSTVLTELSTRRAASGSLAKAPRSRPSSTIERACSARGSPTPRPSSRWSTRRWRLPRTSRPGSNPTCVHITTPPAAMSWSPWRAGLLAGLPHLAPGAPVPDTAKSQSSTACLAGHADIRPALPPPTSSSAQHARVKARYHAAKPMQIRHSARHAILEKRLPVQYHDNAATSSPTE